MNATIKKWKPLTLSFNEGLRDALQQQHHASQFIALAGRHLIARQPDDSNTNMDYLPDHELLVGNELPNGMRVALQLTDLVIYLVDKEGRPMNKKEQPIDLRGRPMNKKEQPIDLGGRPIDEARKPENGISLAGKSKQQVFKELKKVLSASATDVSKLSSELHYEIPAHRLNDGANFGINDKIYFQVNTFYRHNAELVMSNLASLYPNVMPVRVWPHHFDTGTLIPVKYNEKGELSSSIGLGWAIPDGMVDEPYYYLSFWSENPVGEGNEMPALSAGQWMTPNWDGAVLKHSEIQAQGSAEKQFESVASFYARGIEFLRAHLK